MRVLPIDMENEIILLPRHQGTVEELGNVSGELQVTFRVGNRDFTCIVPATHLREYPLPALV
jgi:hypothetical protein